MKRTHGHKALLAATATGLALAAAACSSDQKPAALSTTGAGATSAATSGAAPGSAGSATSATSSAAASSSSGAASTSSAPAPTTVSTAKGGWSYSASVPPDTSIAAALTAFQHYADLSYSMSTTVQHSNDLVNYADGNVLSLLNDFITRERNLSFALQGPEIIKVADATLDANAKVVTVTTCTDDTKLGSIVTSGPKKGQTAPASDKSAYLDIYKVHLSPDGKWRVNSVTPEKSKTCSAR
ncbi:MAG: hypothetical protein HOV83_08150 [Catenulispora sp.]|nr:hypothetical protein [Catenulispora sp.]